MNTPASPINEEFLQEVIDHNGVEKQIVVAIEELSELQKELCKYLRGYENHGPIYEEMADVKIILMELEKIFNNKAEIDAWMNLKLVREQRRINESQGAIA